MTWEDEFAQVCETIVARVYQSLGSRLTDEEVVRLAADLASEILLTIHLHDDQPQDEIAWDTTEFFLRRQGIVDAGDGERWAWMN